MYGAYWAFPEFDRLATATAADLAATIANERRAASLYATIQGLAAADEEWLRTAPYDEAEAWLRRITGIGAWSAAFILMRAVGRMDRMLFDLKPILAILPRVYGPDVTMAQIAERYGPWIGYWGLYLRAAQ